MFTHLFHPGPDSCPDERLILLLLLEPEARRIPRRIPEILVVYWARAYAMFSFERRMAVCALGCNIRRQDILR